jgi:hypothetical protein
MLIRATYTISAKTINFIKKEVLIKLLKGETINKRLRIMDTNVHVHIDVVESLILYISVLKMF